MKKNTRTKSRYYVSDIDIFRHSVILFRIRVPKCEILKHIPLPTPAKLVKGPHTHTHKTNRAFFVRAARESRETELKLYPQVPFFSTGGFLSPPPPFQPSQGRPCPKGTPLVLVVETVHSCRQNFPSLFFSGTFSTLLLRTTAAEWASKATFPEFPLKLFFLLRGKENWEANRYETLSI